MTVTEAPAESRTRESYADPDREFRVLPQEADHYRSRLLPGDYVRGKYGNLAQLVAWNHTWSHVTGGRLAVLRPVVAVPGTAVPDGAQPYQHVSSWESDLTSAQPGDVGAHAVRGPVGMCQHVSASWQS